MRISWGYIAFSFGADAFLSFLIVQFVDGNERFLAFLAFFAMIFAAQIVAKLWSAIKMWGGYHLFTRDKIIRTVLAELHRLDMPSTRAHVDMDTYLADVYDNRELPFKVRAKAGAWISECAAYRVIHPLTTGPMMSIAFDRAMDRYPKPLPGKFDEEEFEEEFFSSLQEHVQEHTPDPAPAPAKIAPTTKPAIITSRPWPRFWARLIDVLLFSLLISFALGLWTAVYAPEAYLLLTSMNEGLWNILLMPVVFLALALVMAAAGTTPGKAIMRVTVPAPADKGRLTFYLVREMKVWIYGAGLGIPIVNLFVMMGQQRLLTDGKEASYDKGNPPIVASPSTLRLCVGIMVALSLFFGHIFLRVEERRINADALKTQLWTNPVTGKVAKIKKTWQPEELKTNSGRAFYFADHDSLAEAVLGYEQFPRGDVYEYANAIKKAISAEVTIVSDWHPVKISGHQTVRATGKSTVSGEVQVEVTIALIGANAWRTIVFNRGRPPDALPGKEVFVTAALGTAN